jgi:hypothetical protein
MNLRPISNILLDYLHCSFEAIDQIFKNFKNESTGNT